MAVQIQMRRGTAAQWTSANPTLAQGEIGFETNTNLFKFGDGTTAWNALAYVTTGGGGLDTDNPIDGTLQVVKDSAGTSTALYLASDYGGILWKLNDQVDSYPLVLSDMFKKVRINKATATNLTVPLNSSVAFPIGTIIKLERIGAGIMTVVATGGVTVTGSAGVLTDPGLNVEMQLEKTGTDTWDLQNGAPGTYQDYIPSFTGFSSPPAISAARYVLFGKMCHVYIRLGIGTSNAGTFTITLPFAAANTGVQYSMVQGINSGSALTTPSMLATRLNSAIADVFRDPAGTAWTSSGNKYFIGNIVYEIA